jgi:hypothetical protein
VKIDTDVARISAHFGIDPRLIQAVVIAEGNILKAVQCSLPNVSTREQALEVTCRSAVHAMSDYVKTHAGPDFVAMWANRWAPQGVANDPTNLNGNWPVNVVKGWLV